MNLDKKEELSNNELVMNNCILYQLSLSSTIG